VRGEVALLAISRRPKGIADPDFPPYPVSSNPVVMSIAVWMLR